MSEQHLNYLCSLINETSQTDICQDFIVKENSVKIKTSKIYVSLVFPFLSDSLILSDVLIIDASEQNAVNDLRSNEDSIVESDSMKHDDTNPNSEDVSCDDNFEFSTECEGHFCDYCPKQFSNRKKLNFHILHRHTKSLQCSQCEKTFPNKSELNRHLEKHSNNYRERSFCKIKIKRLDNFNRHMKTKHFDSKLLTCNFCGKKFTNQSDLNSHLNIHYKIKFPCSKCYKEFSSKSNLTRHKCSS